MWCDQVWHDLLAWCREDMALQRQIVLRAAARSTIRRLLSLKNLSKLTLPQFLLAVCEFGHVADTEERPIDPRVIENYSPARLERMIAANELIVVGNQCLEQGVPVCPLMLPGLEEVRLAEVRDFVADLLYGEGDPEVLVEKAATGDAPVDAACASMILTMCGREPRGIWAPDRLAGLRRLASLIDLSDDIIAAEKSYHCYNEVLARLRHKSGDVLADPLTLDALLVALAKFQEPRAWKIAIGMTVAQAEATLLARECLEHGFAAIAPEEADDPNIARLRSIAPGDCVVMHLRGCIGAIGRVTRPYYELDRATPNPLDRRWWRRIGVKWIAGERDYGALLSGAQRRFSVAELDWDTWWAVADLYRQSPDYDRLFRPLRGAWLINCERSRRDTLMQLQRPLPLRDRLMVNFTGLTPAPGDRVFLCADEEGVFSHARVLSEVSNLGHPGAVRLDLLYENIQAEPVGGEQLEQEPAVAARGTPTSERAAVYLPAEATAALSEELGVSRERLFLLIVDGGRKPALRPRSNYFFSHRVAGEPTELTAAMSSSTVWCLVYHGGPEYAFAGFGRVLELIFHHGAPDAEDSVEIRLDMCSFPRRPRGSAITSHASLHDVGSSRRKAGRIRTVLPISAYDFYRVVGAGMGARTTAVEPLTLDDLAHQCGAPLEVLEEIVRLLCERGQMIFYGPPGTGKTWLALLLAGYLAEGDRHRWKLVQFHPTFSYEDFIEGIRPQVVETGDGGSEVIYPVVPGAFVAFCERARRDPDNIYVLVIDEINRANVANVFGELMFALEYRDQEVALAHSSATSYGPETSGSFVVPHNVLVLATMNTADRSTALIDRALRRRFVFYPFFPGDGNLVDSMFDVWLRRHAPGMGWVTEFVALLNERLEPEIGRHLLIGPSYFMRQPLTEEAVREVWRFQLLPLLEDYFAATPDRLEEFDLEKLINQARARAAAHSECDQLHLPAQAESDSTAGGACSIEVEQGNER